MSPALSFKNFKCPPHHLANPPLPDLALNFVTLKKSGGLPFQNPEGIPYIPLANPLGVYQLMSY